VGDYDSSVKELPHIIRVTNFSFTPIQNFIPSVQPYDDENGLSRYISLDDGSNNNYGLTKAELDLLSKVKF
jgi:hypothetical protein